MAGKPQKVLWLVSITLPTAAAACGLAGAVDVSGGWLTGQLNALRSQVNLTVCSLDKRVSAPTDGEAEGVCYRLLPTAGADFAALVREASPDLIHIWGTEYPAAAALHCAALDAGIPALVGIQGVMAACARHLCEDVPAPYLGSCAIQRAIDRIVPGALLDKEQARFDALAQSEASLLANARYVTGRTAFDKAAAARLAPNARYYLCNETLRPCFYEEPRWQPHDFGTAPVLLLSQGNYPLKNLHTVLKALPALLRRWPALTLQVAGWPPLDRGPLFRPMIRWMFPYQTYCARLAAELGVAGRIRYTGPLQADAMRRAYLDADVFLLPSYCENSPNSLGEAMLLGMPCVAAGVGGVPSMAEPGKEARLYAPAGDAGLLADAVAALLADPAGAQAMGQAARARALHTHNAAENAHVMKAIYDEILVDVPSSIQTAKEADHG